MSKLPIVKTRQIIKVLTALGFNQTHRKGSHFFFSHPNGRTTVIPVHSNQDIGRGLLRAILHDIQISPEKFQKLLKRN